MFDIKPFKTFKEQVEILKERGLIIEDEEEAINILKYINYYRISGYTLTLRKNNVFYKGITFDNIMEIYNFDFELRAILLYLLEYIEISFRTHIAYYHSEKYGPVGYLNYEGFENKEYHKSFVEGFNKLTDNNKRNNEVFIKHHKNIYENKFPIWVSVELLSFDSLSKLYFNSEADIKQRIGIDNYGIKHDYIQNWLHGLVVLRNICAHNGRLYNRPMPIRPKLPNKDKKLEIRNDLVFVYIFIMKKLIKEDKVWDKFLANLGNIVKRYPFVKLSNLGFPSNWNEVLKKS